MCDIDFGFFRSDGPCFELPIRSFCDLEEFAMASTSSLAKRVSCCRKYTGGQWLQEIVVVVGDTSCDFLNGIQFGLDTFLSSWPSILGCLLRSDHHLGL